MTLVALNGKVLPEEEAAIPVRDRGFLFGDGVFTTAKVVNGHVEYWEAHLERMHSQCEALQIIPPTIQVQELIEANQAQEGVWRMKIIVTGGSEQMPRKHGHLLITLKPYLTTPPNPFYLTNYPHPITQPTAKLKTLSYLDRFLVKEYAKSQGVHDAIVSSPEGYLLETAFSNIFWRLGERYFTPDPELPLLEGIALKHLSYPLEPIKCKTIPQEADLFVCNTLMGVVRARLCGF